MSISNHEVGGALLDPAVIAQMANELFAALPGRPAPPPGFGVASAPPATPPVEVGALPVAPAIPPSSAVGPPTEVEFRSLPATVSGATLRPPQAGLTPSALLGPYDFRPELIPNEGFMTLPGVASAPPVTPPVEMGVLSAAPAMAPASAFAPPTEAELRALPASLASAPPQPSPVAPTPPAAPGSSFYFLDAAQFPPATPALPHGDYDFHPEMLPDLGITAGPYDPHVERRDFPVRS
jgi:hypothetical protein